MTHHPQYNSILDEIQDMIEDSISHAGSDGMASDERALELIKDLQLMTPPKPPTCASCNNFDNEVGCLDWQNLIFVKDEIKNKPNHFGCIHHSDYQRNNNG